MTTLAIDRFRAKGLSAVDEATARDHASYLLSSEACLGYLEASIAIALEQPRWRSRRRLAIDLRTVQIAKERTRR